MESHVNLNLGGDDSRFDRIIRSPEEVFDAVPLDDDEEEDRFTRILRRASTSPEISHLVYPEKLSRSMSRMVCSYLPTLLSCKINPKLQFFRVVRGAKSNGEEEVRFHRILRENRDSEPSGFQEMDEVEGLDSDRFQRSLREEKDQRATQGAWSPMGKRSQVSQIKNFGFDFNGNNGVFQQPLKMCPNNNFGGKGRGKHCGEARQ